MESVPKATRIIPIMDDYPWEGVDTFVCSTKPICFTNSENLTTTKPKAIIPMPVLTQARYVRSLARWSLGLNGDSLLLSSELMWLVLCEAYMIIDQ